MKYDFSGWATKNDLLCSDGRIIRHDAFKECDGQTVPLVWQHMHDSPKNVIGTALLENRPEGVYAYGSFNHSENGEVAKELVRHGDLRSLSIYANKLQQQGNNVIHGAIREVSLVLAGANPGAMIDNLSIVHSDGYEDVLEDEAVIYNGLEGGVYVSHADKKQDDEDDQADENGVGSEEPPSDEDLDEESPEKKKTLEHAKEGEDSEESEDDGEAKTIDDIFATMTPEQEEAAYQIIGLALEQAGKQPQSNAQIQHADDQEQSDNQSAAISNLQEIYNSMTEEQQNAIKAIIGLSLQDDSAGEEEDNEGDEGAAQHSDLEDQVMKHNIFDGTVPAENEKVLSHSEEQAIFKDAWQYGSLARAAEAHGFGELQAVDNSRAMAHGIDNIDVFFPDVQNVGDYPAMISRPMEWVQGVLSACHKTPFSKVRSIAANITADEARARGYIKGNKKIEEQIGALKRVTEPQTIYKLQKLDRDDIVDITDFDVVSWIKQEMRVMLDEEVARAILVGDGRGIDDQSKIKETNIRPVWTDEETYSLHTLVSNKLTGQDKAEAFIEAVIRSHKNYKGSGSPTLYVGTDLLTEMRLIKDKMGHRLYKNDQELADEMRVSNIVEIQLFDGLKRTDGAATKELGGIIVNLKDYNCGSTKGGEVNMFDDFDIDYNKYEYLIETRLSGALYVPFSAMVVEFGDTGENPYKLSEFDTTTLGMDAERQKKDTAASSNTGTQASGTESQSTNG